MSRCLNIKGILVNLHHAVTQSDESYYNEIEQAHNDILEKQDIENTKRGNQKGGKGAPSKQSSSQKVSRQFRSNYCGAINTEAVQQVLAAKWAIDVINNQSLPHEIKIGKY